MPENPLGSYVEKLVKTLNLHGSAADKNAPIRLFQGVSEDCLQDLLSHSIPQTAHQGQEIILQGDPVKYLYYIIEGRIKTFRASTEGAEATIRMLQAGETFMDAVIFMGGVSPINATALSESRLLMIPADIVRKQVLQNGQFATNMLKIITQHYKTALQQIDGIITKNPLERLGYYFLKLHIEQNPDSMDIDLPFQKSMIANHLGMTPETFSRALAKLKTMGINIDQERITLRDSYMLCHFCDSDTATKCPRHGTDECAFCEKF